MNQEKLIKTANVLDGFAKIGVAMFLPMSILCGVFGVLSLLFGEAMFSTGELSVTLSYVKLYFHDPAAVPAKALQIFAVLGCIGGGIFLLALWYGLKTFRKVLAPMKQGRPFEPDVARDIRRLGIFTLICGGLSALLQVGLQTALCGMLPVERFFNPDLIRKTEFLIEVDLDFLWIAGLVFLLSYIFQYGQQLQQESDETL